MRNRKPRRKSASAGTRKRAFAILRVVLLATAGLSYAEIASASGHLGPYGGTSSVPHTAMPQMETFHNRTSTPQGMPAQPGTPDPGTALPAFPGDAGVPATANPPGAGSSTGQTPAPGAPPAQVPSPSE